MTTIRVFEITGKNAISMQKGNRIYELLLQKISNDEHVTLDFEGVSLFASPFFNAAIGHLLKDIEIERLQKLMKPIHLNNTGKDLLNLVIDNALTFYANREKDND